jgi:hypothetical protein
MKEQRALPGDGVLTHTPEELLGHYERASAEDHCDVRMGRGRDFLYVGTYFTFTFTASEAPLSPDGTVGIKGSLRMKDQSHLIEFVATLATLSVGRITVAGADGCRIR